MISTDDIARDARSIRSRVSPSPLPGYEYVRGYGVYSLPLDTGHVLALRVFPENDFAIGRAYFEMRDPEAYRRTVEELRSRGGEEPA